MALVLFGEEMVMYFNCSFPVAQCFCAAIVVQLWFYQNGCGSVLLPPFLSSSFFCN